MKRIAFITRHTPSNYGSLLQTYALQRAIEKLGHSAMCINYIREDELPQNVTATRLANSRWNKNAALRLVYRVTQKPVFERAASRFDGFREAFINPHGGWYVTHRQLAERLPEADVYMTGSDQVWARVGNCPLDTAYLLEFVPDNKRKVAYAASFGGKGLPDFDKTELKRLLSRYDYISMREKSGTDLVRSMGLNAETVLDPTLLLTPDEWDLLPWGSLNGGEPRRKPYVLVYQLHPNKKFQAYAKEFAKRSGLELVRVNPYFHHIFKPGKFVYCPYPNEFLRLIKNADYFLTDSFHGTSFAINLNTPFTDVLPGKTGERILNILNIAGLENRVLQSYDDFKAPCEPIDFSAVNKKIAIERERSAGILRKMIET